MATHALAIEVVISGSASFNNTAPTNSQIPNWSSGWGASNITGWNYVGSVNGASGVYLGNGWAISAAHVGAGNLILGDTTYDMVGGSAVNITNSSGTVDVVLFQLSQAPNLPPLLIGTSTPLAFPATEPGDSVAMLGYGGGEGETWGYNTITNVNGQAGVQSFTSNDFETTYGQVQSIDMTINNYATLVADDSGGGDFIYESSLGEWTLAGINEEVSHSNSFFVQLSTYASQINAITAVPEPDSLMLSSIGAVALLFLVNRNRPKLPPVSLPRLCGTRHTNLDDKGISADIL